MSVERKTNNDRTPYPAPTATIPYKNAKPVPGEIILDTEGEIMKRFFEWNDPAAPIIGQYDMLFEYLIPNILKNFKIIIQPRTLENPNEQILVFQPEYSLNRYPNETPYECRLKNITY